jgi:hypothetical protein
MLKWRWQPVNRIGIELASLGQRTRRGIDLWIRERRDDITPWRGEPLKGIEVAILLLFGLSLVLAHLISGW